MSETMAFTWGFQVARARGIFLSEDPEHLSSSMTSHVGLSWRTYSVCVCVRSAAGL